MAARIQLKIFTVTTKILCHFWIDTLFHLTCTDQNQSFNFSPNTFQVLYLFTKSKNSNQDDIHHYECVKRTRYTF